MVNMKYLLNRRSFISLMVLFSFFDNFGMEEKGNLHFWEYDHLFKVVFVGDADVGKTQIVNKFMKNSFEEEYKPTTSVNYSQKEINFDEKNIKLELWDTSGQEKYRNLTNIFCRDFQLIVLVYAVNDKKTFENIQNWVKDVRNINEDAKFLLVGNKCDLKDQRQVTYEKAQEYAKKNEMEFIEVSAKEGTNINDDMFKSSIEKILNDMEKEKISYDDIYNNTNNSEQKDLLVDQDIYYIKNKKNFCWRKYCSCCSCWEKTEGNGEEEEEVENDE